MFSQGEPVLAGVDLDSGYLFGLSLSAQRDGAAWSELLREGRGAGACAVGGGQGCGPGDSGGGR